MTQGTPVARGHVASQLLRYWPRGREAVEKLAVAAAPAPTVEPLPPRLASVALPEWARDLGVEGALLVPLRFVPDSRSESWRGVDWWGVARWYLDGAAERAFERQHGSIHSYSFRLKDWDARMWERAWVNRIALFLRRWAASELGQREDELFGALPRAEILLTHDVDAIRKTTAIRFKQTAFHGYNALRYAARGRLDVALDKLGSAVRFFFGASDYWHFEEIERAEEQAGVRSCFFVYGGDPRLRTFKQVVLDPAYDVREPRLSAKLRVLAANGWQVGLHQSFEAWRDAGRMLEEKAQVEAALQSRITMCRQHWLRFGWRDTWAAQYAAGFETDATLGFNDRPGFRNGAALRFHPWHEAAGAALRLASLPMVLMDSHVYDYSHHSAHERVAVIRHWLEEVRAVHGCATVIWHQHTLGPDYGWRSGFDSVVELAAPG